MKVEVNQVLEPISELAAAVGKLLAVIESDLPAAYNPNVERLKSARDSLILTEKLLGRIVENNRIP